MLGKTDRQLVLIWDGASYHRSQKVHTYAAQLGFHMLPLPGYSPDLNPHPMGTRGLWKWLREVVTQHYCHQTLDELRQACQTFIDHINRDSLQVISRLWPRFDLDPDAENLRFLF